MNEHTGFREYKDGKRFNPECQVCLEEKLRVAADARDFKMGQSLIAMMELAKWQIQLVLNNYVVIKVKGVR